MSQNVPGSPVIKNMQQAQGNIATYIVRGSPLERKQHAAGISMEKNEKISVSIDRYTKSKKEVSGEFFFCIQLPCLPTGNCSLSWTVDVCYTPDFFEP